MEAVEEIPKLGAKIHAKKAKLFWIFSNTNHDQKSIPALSMILSFQRRNSTFDFLHAL